MPVASGNTAATRAMAGGVRCRPHRRQPGACYCVRLVSRTAAEAACGGRRLPAQTARADAGCQPTLTFLVRRRSAEDDSFSSEDTLAGGQLRQRRPPAGIDQSDESDAWPAGVDVNYRSPQLQATMNDGVVRLTRRPDGIKRLAGWGGAGVPRHCDAGLNHGAQAYRDREAAATQTTEEGTVKQDTSSRQAVVPGGEGQLPGTGAGRIWCGPCSSEGLDRGRSPRTADRPVGAVERHPDRRDLRLAIGMQELTSSCSGEKLARSISDKFSPCRYKCVENSPEDESSLGRASGGSRAAKVEEMVGVAERLANQPDWKRAQASEAQFPAVITLDSGDEGPAGAGTGHGVGASVIAGGHPIRRSSMPAHAGFRGRDRRHQGACRRQPAAFFSRSAALVGRLRVMDLRSLGHGSRVREPAPVRRADRLALASASAAAPGSGGDVVGGTTAGEGKKSSGSTWETTVSEDGISFVTVKVAEPTESVEPADAEPGESSGDETADGETEPADDNQGKGNGPGSNNGQGKGAGNGTGNVDVDEVKPVTVLDVISPADETPDVPAGEDEVPVDVPADGADASGSPGAQSGRHGTTALNLPRWMPRLPRPPPAPSTARPRSLRLCLRHQLPTGSAPLPPGACHPEPHRVSPADSGHVSQRRHSCRPGGGSTARWPVTLRRQRHGDDV